MQQKQNIMNMVEKLYKSCILYLHIIFNATGLLSLDPSVLTARHT